jgi:hypothetical protein
MSDGVCTGTLKALLEDTYEIHDLAVELLDQSERPGLFLEPLQYKAFAQFNTAVKNLSRTSLSDLKREGVKTTLTDGKSSGTSRSHIPLTAMLSHVDLSEFGGTRCIAHKL